MKVYLLILTLGLLALGMQAAANKNSPKTFDFASHIGVASLNPAGQLCLNVKNSNLTPGAELALVSLDKPQAVFRAKVIEKLDKACSEWDVSGEAKNFYSLEVSHRKIDSTIPLIAILNPEAKFLVSRSGVQVDVNQDGLPETFKSCVSSEGLHLTMWSGKPLIGKRQWHIYYYLGYDMKGDCTKKESRE